MSLTIFQNYLSDRGPKNYRIWKAKTTNKLIFFCNTTKSFESYHKCHFSAAVAFLPNLWKSSYLESTSGISNSTLRFILNCGSDINGYHLLRKKHMLGWILRVYHRAIPTDCICTVYSWVLHSCIKLLT